VAIKVKPLTDVVKKWVDVTPMRAGYYEAEASVAGADWEKGATAASSAYKAGVSAPNIEKMYTGGIKRAGSEKYERKVKAVGAARFGPGVVAAEADFSTGVGPMLDVIRGITLAPRQPRGALANYERVKAIGVELNKKRLAIRAAG